MQYLNRDIFPTNISAIFAIMYRLEYNVIRKNTQVYAYAYLKMLTQHLSSLLYRL